MRPGCVVTVTALGVAQCADFPVIGACPMADTLQNWNDRRALVGETVFHARGNFIELFTAKHAVRDQLFQIQGQHSIADVRTRPKINCLKIDSPTPMSFNRNIL